MTGGRISFCEASIGFCGDAGCGGDECCGESGCDTECDAIGCHVGIRATLPWNIIDRLVRFYPFVDVTSTGAARLRLLLITEPESPCRGGPLCPPVRENQMDSVHRNNVSAFRSSTGHS